MNRTSRLAIKISFSLLLFFPLSVFAGSKIKAYFNNPVNTVVAHGQNAVYLPGGTMGDTIVAYINRARYSVDIAQYDYTQDSWSGAYANIATAANNAYLRGVTVRWLYDAGQPNSGLSSLNSGIHKLGRPSGGSGIMHDKFIIIDANSSSATDAIVCTGSEDWSSEMMYHDYNNILFIQDSALAHVYTAEFNMMWGSTTATPNASLAKFGSAKTNLGRHSFTIDGHLVELYFSPSDGTNNHILSSIATANKDLYMAVYCVTESPNATAIVAKKDSGIYTLAIVDQYTATASSTVFYSLNTGLGASNFKEYTGSYIYHNKMMIVDPNDTCSDPQVLTGSHNWTFSADTYNDENTLIIHSDTLANVYYQSFYANFISLGGSPAGVTGCGASSTTGTGELQPFTGEMRVWPNPSAGVFTFSYWLAQPQFVDIEIYSLAGQKVLTVTRHQWLTGEQTAHFSLNEPGMYFLRARTGDAERTFRLCVVPQ